MPSRSWQRHGIVRPLPFEMDSIREGRGEFAGPAAATITLRARRVTPSTSFAERATPHGYHNTGRLLRRAARYRQLPPGCFTATPSTMMARCQATPASSEIFTEIYRGGDADISHHTASFIIQVCFLLIVVYRYVCCH